MPPEGVSTWSALEWAALITAVAGIIGGAVGWLYSTRRAARKDARDLLRTRLASVDHTTDAYLERSQQVIELSEKLTEARLEVGTGQARSRRLLQQMGVIVMQLDALRAHFEHATGRRLPPLDDRFGLVAEARAAAVAAGYEPPTLDDLAQTPSEPV